MTYPIPDKALDDRLGFIGMTGSGKTYGAGTCVERILAKKGRVIIPDALGVWWGLRQMADGATASPYDIVIFGGPNGDVPISPNAGALIGEAVATMRESAIIDLSQFETAASERRFMLAFLDAIYRRAVGEPAHIIFDEADLWAPERILDKKGEAATLHGMMQTVVRRGRTKGLTSWLISQRPAALSKSVLSQIDGLVAFRLTGSHDRKALGLWLAGQADADEGKAILARLPTKQKGEAVVWLPLHGVLNDVMFPAKVTFDSSRTPKRGEKQRAVSLKPIDIGKLRDKLSTIEAEVKAHDPKLLKAEIARLRAEVARSPTISKMEIDPKAIEAARDAGYRQGYEHGHAAGKKQIFDEIWGRVDSFTHDVADLFSDLVRKSAAIAAPPSAPPGPVVRPAPQPNPKPALIRRPANRSGDAGLPVGERSVLIAAAQMEGVDRDQLSVLTGYKRSTRDAYIKRLREKGYIRLDDQSISVTEEGMAALPADYEPLPTGRDLQEYWRQKLPEGERRILDVLVEAHPNEVTRPDLDEVTGFKRSTRDAYIQRMKAKRLVIIDGGAVRASDNLF